MALDGITVANLVYELNKELSNSRINKIAQPEHDELLITIKTSTGQKRLLISANPSLPLLYLIDSNKPSPMTAPNFCMLLRKYIGSGRITSITQPSLERVIFIDIEHLDELGDLSKKRLVIELMGKHSNIIFIDDKNIIIDSIKHVSLNVSSVREVLPGREYFIPDQSHKLSPLDVSQNEFVDAIKSKPMELSASIFKSFTGISPLVSEEICYISGVNESIDAKSLDSDTLLHLYKQFIYYMEDVKTHTFTPSIYYDNDIPIDYSSLPLTHYNSYRLEKYDSICSLLADFYRKKEINTRIRQKSVDLRHIVTLSLERNVKKYKLQLRQLDDTEDRNKFKEYGELINAYGYNLEEGSKELKAFNYYSEKDVVIPIDPTKTPSENSQKYFAKYNKKKRTFEAVSELVKETKEEIDYLSSVSSALDNALSESDLQEIKEELMQSGYVKRRHEKRNKQMEKSKPLCYKSTDGYDIYVGQNNLQNEHISFDLAKGNDWWFHVKDAPGSHVVVINNTDDEITDKTFEEAAKLAAYYSSRRESDKIEVDYTLKKNLKKPKGTKPGFVVYYTNYSITTDSNITDFKQV
ncbi:MAG: NFACT family protein [Suipraeoptans sp.]